MAIRAGRDSAKVNTSQPSASQLEVANAIYLAIQSKHTKIPVLFRGFDIGKVVIVGPLAPTRLIGLDRV